MVKRTCEELLMLSWLAISWPLCLSANEIYHWVDDQGVNHYSQSPPPSASSEVQTLNVDGSQPASFDPNEDRYHVAAQAEATQAVRDKLAENRKNKQVAQQNAPETTVIYYPQEERYNDMLYPPGYRPRPPFPRPPRPPHSRPDRPTNLPADAPAASKPFRPIRP